MLFQTLLAHLNRATPCVWVSVAATQGSTPRETGAGMAVTRDALSGTIGGGHLELKAVELAREWLRLEKPGATRRHYPLGPALGQCCGGAVDLLFRPLTAPERPWLEALARAEQSGGELALDTVLDAGAPHTARNAAGQTADDAPWVAAAVPSASAQSPAQSPRRSPPRTVTVTRHTFRPWHVWVFGAGHVGHALAQVFGALPCYVTWVDGRDTAHPPVFPPVFPSVLPDNVTTLQSAHPPDEVGDIPAGADVLVLTHSHALDLEITAQLLQRDDLGYLGLIGSDTKAQLFRRRLAARGLDAARLVCPIGLAADRPSPVRKDKHPGAIAVSVAADLLARRHGSDGSDPVSSNWRLNR